jgi:hypothetical protein
MGFNKRKMADRRRREAEKEAAARRATEKQILEDADHLVAVWKERQAKRMSWTENVGNRVRSSNPRMSPRWIPAFVQCRW